MESNERNTGTARWRSACPETWNSVERTFRLEEYVDAELANGQAYSWSLEIVLNDLSINVEAEIRKIHDAGRDLVEQIAACEFSDIVHCSTNLVGTVETLCRPNLRPN